MRPDIPAWFGEDGALRLDVDMKGVLKQGTPLWRLLLNAWSTNFVSDDGSILQKLPFPGSS